MYSERFKGLTPYTPGEQPKTRKYIKLNTNENPYPPSPLVRDFLKKMDYQKLNLYPDPGAASLRGAIAEYYSLDPENIFTGNGSDEVLSFSFFAFFDSSRGPLLFPEHTYSFYPVYCSYYSIDYRKIPLEKDFSLSMDSFPREEKFSGIVFPNPNAPTGIVTSISDIRRLLADTPNDKVVIIDEAYIDFGGESAIPLTKEFDNLLVVQTFSKSRSLAGLRIGFAAGSRDLITALDTVKDSFNSYPLNYISQGAGKLAMEDTGYFNETVSKIIKTRDNTISNLQKAGWEVLPSTANFVFTRKKGLAGSYVYSYLKNKGVLVRHFNHPGIEEFIRITIGKPEEMSVLLNLLDNFTV